MAKQTYLTAEGLKKLQDELEYYKVTRRKEVAEALKVAKAFGDLSENSEYTEAKNEQAEVESHIAELEAALANVEIIVSGSSKSRVAVGSTVVITGLNGKKEDEFTIVGSQESDPFKNKISDESPVGRALLGKKVGETAVADAPGGQIKLKVVAIK